jgi:ribosomal protein S18 acetylase RimI-like enzyme
MEVTSVQMNIWAELSSPLYFVPFDPTDETMSAEYKRSYAQVMLDEPRMLTDIPLDIKMISPLLGGRVLDTTICVNDADVVFGAVTMWTVGSESKVMSLFRLPSAKGLYVGSILLRHALDDAYKADLRVITLDVFPNNLYAYSFYASIGFETLGEDDELISMGLRSRRAIRAATDALSERIHKGMGDQYTELDERIYNRRQHE